MVNNYHYLFRFSAFCLAVFGLYIFMHGSSDRQLRILDDGSLADPNEKSLVSFRYPKSVLSLNAGFDRYRSITYGISSFCLLLDLVVGCGYLTLPALFIAAGEIINDVSDFLVAVVLICKNIGLYPAGAYGLIYLSLLIIEILLWIGTCKYHESCRLAKLKKEISKKRETRINRLKSLRS